MPMNRYQASLAHFAISLAVAFLVYLLLRHLWYPGPLFDGAGGRELLFVVVAVDVTLGPLITLIVYKPGKWGLRFDLATIAVLQLAALAYGLHAILESRPIWIAFVKDRFELVRAIDVDDADLAKARPPFDRRAWTGPAYIGAVVPADPRAQLRLLDSAIIGGKDVHTYPEYYVPYEAVSREVAAQAQPVAKLHRYNPDAPEEIRRTVAATRRAEGELGFLPMRAGKVDLTVLVDRRSGVPLAMSTLKPWDY